MPESAQRERDLIEVYDLEDTYYYDDWEPFEDPAPPRQIFSLIPTVLVGSLSEVSHLTNLTHLDITESQVDGQIGSLRGLTDLAFLNMAGTYRLEIYGDLSPLSNLTSMTSLDISRNNLSGDLSPLRNLTSMTSLSILE